LHLQNPDAQAKLVAALAGEVFDVAVDVRAGSPTFLRWHAELLTADNHKTLLLPEGFAHGFQALCDDCEVLYLHTDVYDPDAEGALHAEDPRLGIRWPLPISGLSPRDATHPFVTSDCSGVAQ
jgi:dTDP-4-dehydrorhamnose 3,5-epimerase